MGGLWAQGGNSPLPGGSWHHCQEEVWLAQAKYEEQGTVLSENQLAQMSKQLGMFKTNLKEFTSKHKQEIPKNLEYRVQFQDIRATIGVDHLSSGKGFWSEVLGMGDLYYELGVQTSRCAWQ